MVLLADRFLEEIDLDFARLLGQLGRDAQFFFQACRALSSAVVKLPEEPRPVPAGISAMEVISSERSAMPSREKASRMIGCSIWLGVSTRSSLEYLRINPGLNVSFSVR